MKKPSARQAFAYCIGLACALSAMAQSQPSSSSSASTATATEDEDLVTLSPFEVQADRDVGFVPTTSLAGGRLATELKNTPMAYSVLTREFLDALNLTTQEDAMTWAVGSYRPVSSGTDLRFYNYEGGGATVSRGLWITGSLRNFFEFGVDSDTYSQDRIDFARGANALLVGSGTLGGKVITMTKRADTERRFGRVTATFGSYNNLRGTIDYNQPLTDKLALRTNLLIQQSDTWRDKEYDKRHAIHFAGTYRPFKSTTLRAEYEVFRNDRRIGSENLGDQISGWDGVSVVDAPVATIANADARGLARIGSSTSPYLVYIPGSDAGTIMNWANTWRTQGGAANANVPVGGVLALSTANLGINNGRMVGDVYDRDSRFHLAEGGSSFVRPTSKNVNIPSSPGVIYDFDDVAFFLEHKQGEHLFFDAGYNHAKTKKLSEYIVPGGLSTTQIDVNRTLPDGSANPNFLVPYGDAYSGHQYFYNTYDEVRVALAAVFDRTRFGDYRFGLIGGNMRREALTTRYSDVFARDSDIRRRPERDQFQYRYYWNQFAPLTVPDNVQVVDPVAGTSNNYDVDTMLDIFRPANIRLAKTEYTYLQGTLNAKLFDGRLNLLGGVRRDSYKIDSLGLNSNAAANANDFPADWDGRKIYWLPAAPADYWDLIYQPKNADGTPIAGRAPEAARTRPRTNGVPQAQYANDRFRDDYNSPKIDFGLTTVTYGGVVHPLSWFSVFANYSESFNAPIAGLTLTGATVPPGQSDGWDAGIRLNLLEGRIVASASRYGSEQVNNSFDSTGQTRKYANIVAANQWEDGSTTGTNTRGLPLIPIPTFDFQDRKADGFEFEVVANITSDWRLTANYSKPDVSITNQHQDQWAYLNANEATLRQIVIDSGATIDANNVASADPNITPALPADRAAAITGWNDIQTFKATNDPTRSTFSNLPKFTANLFTDYKFSRGPLKGFRFGGGANYFDKRVIGNRGADTIVNPSNPNAAIDDPNVDISTLVYMKSYYIATATIAYQRRLADNRELIINLAIRNLLGNDDPIYAGANLRPPNGDILRPDRTAVPAGYINQPRRSFTLSTTLTF